MPLSRPTPYHRTSHHHAPCCLRPFAAAADSASLFLHPSSLQQPTPPLCAASLLQSPAPARPVPAQETNKKG
ncbi:hypothetical protein SLEP1_g52059 [Rubroshorea leprosula]|uniref:Uncharacterized protein n=1 Tax=Rubroshorea leprosula TaxID=152421 RepID=A0AAV5M5B3_9ROSI|nr:hypothetical protein SLEP1_g52059 [Rubroshorea leprosula]